MVRITRLSILICLFAVTSCASEQPAQPSSFENSMVAQKPGNVPLKVVYEDHFLNGELISPDGRFFATIGKPTTKRGDGPEFLAQMNGIWLTDIDAQKLPETDIVSGAPFFCDITGDMNFSPDSSHLVFTATGGRSSEIYRVRSPQGSLAYQITGDTCYRCENSHAIYSPDGKMIAVTFIKSVKNDPPTHQPLISDPDFPREQDVHPEAYVGVLPSDATEEAPEKLVRGSPMFWSADSKSIYYICDRTPDLCRLDLRTRHSQAVMPYSGTIFQPLPGQPDKTAPVMVTNILDKDPASETFIVTDGKGSLSVKKIGNGPDMNPDLAKAIESLAMTDDEGRTLKVIHPVGHRKLFLSYESAPQKPGAPLHPLPGVPLLPPPRHLLVEY